MKLKFHQPHEVNPLSVVGKDSTERYEYVSDFVGMGQIPDELANEYARKGWRLHSVWVRDGVIWMMFER